MNCRYGSACCMNTRCGQGSSPDFHRACLVPFLLGLPQSLSFDSANGRIYLLDIGAWVKSFVAIGAFMLA